MADQDILANPRFTQLRRGSPVPLYVQIRDSLVGAIKDGSLAAGDRIPSEPELVAAFKVGRPTVRQALEVLRREGLVATHRGMGTFVADTSPEVSLLGFDGFARRLEARGIELRSKVLVREQVERPGLDVLHVEEPGPWWLVVRLRSVVQSRRTTPLCIETDAFALSRFADAASLFDSTGSATAVRQHHGVEIARVEVSTRAIAVPERWRGELDLRRGAPVLAMERLHHDFGDGVPHIATFVVRTDVVPLVDHLTNTALRGW